MFSLETKIVKSDIKCKIETDHCAGDQFYYYLMKDGAIIDRSEWTPETEYSKTLVEPGSYHIQAHLKREGTNTLKRSGSLFFKTESCLDELKRLWDSGTLPDIEPPNLYTLKEPFSSFLVHHSITKHETSAILATEVDPNLRKTQNIEFANGSLKLYQFSESHLPCKSIILFSGTAICKSQFIFGDRDLTADMAAEDLGAAIGNFVSVTRRSDRVTVQTDYFGFGKIFYYKDNNNTFLSNSYHLLLKALKAAGFELKIDYDIALSKINFVGLQPFYQNFSRRMDVAGVICLPVDKLIYFDNGGMHINDKPISSALQDGRKVSDDEYNKLLESARQEIISNLNIVAKHEKFERIIVDVSGGMDSRLVFSAVTNLPEHRKKIVINSQDTRGAPDELNVALAINSKYGYPYDATAETIVMPQPKELYDNISSYYMGSYYSFNYSNLKTQRPGTIRITGFGGEIVARPYFARLHLNGELDTFEVSDFADRYFDKFGYLSVFGTNSKFHTSAKTIFSEELNLLPGTGALEKFDIHYLYYRNGLHCSESLRTDNSGPEFAILQSKSAFALKKRCFTEHKSVKLQLDLMNALNPFLAQYPYESDMDNEAKATLSSSLASIPACWRNLKLEIDGDRHDWEATQQKKRKLRTVECENYDLYKKQFTAMLDSRLDNILSALKIICDKNEHLIDSFAVPVYYFAKNNFKGQASGTQFQNLYTKLISTANQIRLIS
ncbi:MAG: hypothetical protein ACN6P0_19680 [Pseudomonas capeferrum]|uniref:hypothetical protein n=1 Tax=Pseudomonas capeferrum TaxID=1495066 RepID=UPI003D09DA78